MWRVEVSFEWRVPYWEEVDELQVTFENDNHQRVGFVGKLAHSHGLRIIFSYKKGPGFPPSRGGIYWTSS